MLPLLIAGSVVLFAVGCGPDAPDDPGTGFEAPTEDPGGGGGETGGPDGEASEDPESEPEEQDEQPEAGEEADPDTSPEPIDGEQTTEDADDGEFGVVAVTDVRLATHGEFDRLVFEIDGDGVAGWDVRYVDEASSQGSGEPVEVAGDAVLAVALRNVTLPPELDDDLQIWDENRLDGPEGGVIAEVVNDTIYEGIQLFFVGLDRERDFMIERFDDPQRVVIDLPHHD